MNLFDYFFGQRPGRVAHRRNTAKLTLENLENRCVPATLVGQLDLDAVIAVPQEDPQAKLIFKGMGVYKNVDQQTGETAMLLPAVQKVHWVADTDSGGTHTFKSGVGAGKVQQIDIHFTASLPDEEAALKGRHIILSAEVGDDPSALIHQPPKDLLISRMTEGDSSFPMRSLGSNPDEPNFMLLPAVQKLTAEADADVAAALIARKAGGRGRVDI